MTDVELLREVELLIEKDGMPNLKSRFESIATRYAAMEKALREIADDYTEPLPSDLMKRIARRGLKDIARRALANGKEET